MGAQRSLKPLVARSTRASGTTPASLNGRALGFDPRYEKFDSFRRNLRGVAQIEERLAWDQEVEMAEFSTPTSDLKNEGT
jgi:hypothetical protein